MASKYLQKFPVPTGFQQILADFTRQVLRDQPQNIIQYAAQYFEILEKGGKFEFESKFNVRKEQKQSHQSYNPQNAQEITKKATKISNKLNEADQKKKEVPAVEHAHPKQIISQKSVDAQEVNSYMQELNSKIEEDEENTPGSPLHAKNQYEQGNQHQENQQNQENQNNQLQTRFEQVFQKYDVSGDGFLDDSQILLLFEDIQQQYNLKITRQEFEEVMLQFDRNGDGKVSKQQILSVLRSDY